MVRLKQRLDAEVFRLPIRIDGGGRSTGGGLFSRGHVYANALNSRGILGVRNPGQFPPTSWWSGGDSNL